MIARLVVGFLMVWAWPLHSWAQEQTVNCEVLSEPSPLEAEGIYRGAVFLSINGVDVRGMNCAKIAETNVISEEGKILKEVDVEIGYPSKNINSIRRAVGGYDLLIFFANRSESSGQEGPFGLVWGVSPAMIEYQLLDHVDLDGLQAFLEYKGDELANSKKACASSIEALEYPLTPADWGLSNTDGMVWAENRDKISSLSGLLGLRKLNAGGAVSAIIYEIKILDESVPACLVFFKNRLFSIAIPNHILGLEKSARIDAVLESKYDRIFADCIGAGGCMKEWIDLGSRTFIRKSTHFHPQIEYTYLPIKREQLIFWANHAQEELSEDRSATDF